MKQSQRNRRLRGRKRVLYLDSFTCHQGVTRLERSRLVMLEECLDDLTCSGEQGPTASSRARHFLLYIFETCRSFLGSLFCDPALACQR